MTVRGSQRLASVVHLARHAKRRPGVWGTAVVLPAIGAIALWQGLGAFLERLDEAAVPHRVG